MKARTIFIVIIILIISFVFLFYLLHTNTDDKPSLVTVTQGDIAEKVTAVGMITAEQIATVKSPISGKVTKLLHDQGDRVTKDEPLLEIQPNPTPSDYAQTLQTLQIDRAKEQEAEKDLARYQWLLKNKAISAQDKDYNKAISTYQQNHLQRILDQQKLDLLDKGETQIGVKTIANIVVSPTDGYILQRNINLGDSVVAQTDYQAGNMLFTIANMHNLLFKGQVSEIDVAKLHTGMPATIKIAALPDNTLQGTLSKIALQSTAAASADLNASSGNNAASSNQQDNNAPFAVGFKLEINQLKPLDNINLRAGYSANAEITVAQSKNTLLLPARVLQFDDAKPYVLLVIKNAKPQKRFIKIGLSDGMQVEILNGLALDNTVLETPPKDEKNSVENPS